MLMITITDSSDQKIKFFESPKRVISLIPSITETLFDLGVGDAVAGISKYCIHPAEAVKGKRNVGGQKNPDFDEIAEIDPDLIILNREENKPEHIDYLSRRYKTWITYPKSVSDAEQLLLELGHVFGAESKASEFAEQIRNSVKQLRSNRMTKLRTLYLIWRNPWMSINHDTFIHQVMDIHQLENVYRDHAQRYFNVTAEDIEAANPDVIILPDEPYHFLEKHKHEFSHLAVSAVKNERIFLADGTYFCWYGSRTAKASRYIQEHILSHLFS
ncbi:ABC transporter substrate-binding protein [bacterium]|nr:ABC transporter substrate-binding protein [bacterium]